MKLKDYLQIALRHPPGKLVLLLVCMLLAGALEGVSVSLFLPLVKIMTRGESSVTLPYTGLQLTFAALLVSILALFALKAAFVYWQKWWVARLVLDFERSLKQDIYSAVFESDWKFFLQEKTGTFASAMSQNARIAADVFKVLTLLATEAVYIVVYCVIGLSISFPAFLLSIAAGMVPLWFLRGYIGRSREIGAQAVAMKNETMGRVIEDFSGAKSIKGNRLEKFREKQVFEMLSDVMRTELRGEKFAAKVDSFPDLLMAVVVCLVLFVSRSVLRVPGENLLVLVMVLYRMSRRLILFQGYKQRFWLYLPYYDLCRDVVSKARERKETSGSRCFEGLERGVELSGVDFSYDSHPVLKSLSMTIRKNALTAIVGRSGSGKTTIVDLVTGLLRPDAGRVLVDGVDLSEYDVFSWRKKIAYVPQECLLVNGTIEENIRMDDGAATFTAVEEAARQAHADEFIRRQPDGYGTRVGDRGLRLSGGQRQRIALARALLRKPELLILDEATSALDSESENKVQQAIETLRGKLTILVIAHRFSTIERSDIVYTLENGSSSESGVRQLQDRR